MIKIAPIVMLLASACLFVACTAKTSSPVVETVPSTVWQAQCLRDISQEVPSLLTKHERVVPEVESLDWDISVELKGAEAHLEILPVSEPTLRGGGGRYLFLCAEKKLIFVEGYR